MTIRFFCPACKHPCSAPDDAGGRKGKCPKCGAAMEVPVPKGEVYQPPPKPPTVVAIADVLPAPARQPAYVPNPAGFPISAAVGFQCPFCKSTAMPLGRDQISQTGWVLFVVLLISCFPLCIIGLFIKEQVRVCSNCGMKLGTAG
ncbi:MAG: LITAF-like zinc ribbon domain-containing protein [Gemmataceae bacterium]|nr:LITAF-like zinc ribbon domain-containing protein [Gemmataceae bacterium]